MKRTFSSYGPVDIDVNYYVPRTELVNRTYNQLIGENPEKGGHYFTIWAPRQTGKTWLGHNLRQVFKKDERFDYLWISVENIKGYTDVLQSADYIVNRVFHYLKKEIVPLQSVTQFVEAFSAKRLEKPLILVIDEFDALEENVIHEIVTRFRDIYLSRIGDENDLFHKEYLLHGLALIGVRSVLGIENVKGSPFNVQRSVHIPNLTQTEVQSMFDWYQRESGQTIEQEVIDQIFYETQGQPGLVSWFGELLTEEYNNEKDKPITVAHWESVLLNANSVLPNNTIMNLISKARNPEYKPYLLEIFRSAEKTIFSFDAPPLNYLYMNGIIDFEEATDANGKKQKYARFTCPFIQKRLFNRFSRELFDYMGTLYVPFDDISDSITDETLNLKNILKRYETYLKLNRSWLLKDAPRRSDMKIFEAIYHFNLYSFLQKFLYNYGSVYPEFPTGNGKVDLLIKYRQQLYALEVKSYNNEAGYKNALQQATQYAKELNLKEIVLVIFVEVIPDTARARFEKEYIDQPSQTTVVPVFIETGN